MELLLSCQFSMMGLGLDLRCPFSTPQLVLGRLPVADLNLICPSSRHKQTLCCPTQLYLGANTCHYLLHALASLQCLVARYQHLVVMHLHLAFLVIFVDRLLRVRLTCPNTGTKRSVRRNKESRDRPKPNLRHPLRAWKHLECLKVILVESMHPR